MLWMSSIRRTAGFDSKFQLGMAGVSIFARAFWTQEPGFGPGWKKHKEFHPPLQRKRLKSKSRPAGLLELLNFPF